VALTRFGMYGNSATNKMIGDYFNIGRKCWHEHLVVAAWYNYVLPGIFRWFCR
jgi:hypothetical protein